MNAKALVYAALLCFATGSVSAQAPVAANQVNNDPLPIQPLNPKAFVQSANKSLSPTERAGLCQKGPGSLTIVCQVDNLGRIAAVTSVKLYKATGELPAPVVAKLSDGIRRDVRFPVITAAKGTPQSKYREVWMDYTLASFCE